MINVVLDTLVFGFQKMGGVSVVWYEYIKRMLIDERIRLFLLDVPGEYVNYLYRDLDTSSAKHLKEFDLDLQILRNTSPNLPDFKEPTIFQSTYLRTSKQENVKNVVMIHDVTHQLYFNGVKKWLNSFQKFRAIDNADGIVYISENTRRDVNKMFKKSNDVCSTVIYNSASDEYKILESSKIPGSYSELIGEKYFIYVGDRFEYKNTSFFYKILKNMPEIHCVLIGGREFSTEEKRNMVGVTDRIHRYTKVTNTDLNTLYNNAFCMIFPSLYEGFGIPILEAMKSGCPVIAFNNSSIPEVLRGSGIILQNDDIFGCLDALKKLEIKETRDEIITNQLKAASFFSWERSYEKLIEFYEKVLGR